MKKSNKFSPEVRERAVRMVLEHRGAYPSLWAAIESIAPKIGCVPQTLNEWVKRAEVDAGGYRRIAQERLTQGAHFSLRLFIWGFADLP
ncbi:Transposase [Paracidovorax anthurii]|uniref:Transposase n=1 Tax=Paracidovorax anthurii TaxID=78229 RepID=A0A328YYE0_9BURK|nr:transposase [Paracidovorax anthurii]